MWADAAIAGSAVIAVGTEKAESGREMIPHEPCVHPVMAQFEPLFVTADLFNVVNRQKLLFSFPAAFAPSPVVIEDDSHVVCVIYRRPFQQGGVQMGFGDVKSLISGSRILVHAGLAFISTSFPASREVFQGLLRMTYITSSEQRVHLLLSYQAWLLIVRSYPYTSYSIRARQLRPRCSSTVLGVPSNSPEFANGDYSPLGLNDLTQFCNQVWQSRRQHCCSGRLAISNPALRLL